MPSTRKAFAAIADYFGSEYALAKKLKVVPSTLSKWKVRGNIPPTKCLEIHKLSKGAIPLHVLNPKIYPVPQ